MNTKPQSSQPQPRPPSLALLLFLLPGPAQPRCAFSPRARPSLPCRSMNSVVHPPAQFSLNPKNAHFPHSSHLSYLSYVFYLSDWSFPGQLEFLPATKPSKLENLRHKEVKNGHRNVNNAPKMVKNSPKRSRYAPLFSALAPNSDNIQYAFHDIPLPMVVGCSRSPAALPSSTQSPEIAQRRKSRKCALSQTSFPEP